MQQLLKTMGYIPSGIIENLAPGDPEVVYFHDLGERAVYGALDRPRTIR
jgi:hypothetical protein